MCGFSLSVALKRLFLRCLASLYIVKKFLLYSNYKCTCAYSKIQISVRMPSDVRILHIPEISICITSVWLATLANYWQYLGAKLCQFGGGGGGGGGAKLSCFGG